MSDIVDVSWSEEPISYEKLQVMAENTRKLRNMLPTTIFKHNGINKNTGLKVLAGSVVTQPRNTWAQTSEVYFGNVFSVGCNPIVVTEHYHAQQKGINMGIFGIGNTNLPDHRGFVSYMWADDRDGLHGKIIHPIVIGYIAIGW